MNGFGTALDATDMQTPVSKVDGVPAQGDQLGDAQPMSIGDQDHGGVTVAVTVAGGHLDEAIYLAVGKVLARANIGIAPAAWGTRSIVNCPNNGGWRHQRQMRFSHGFSG